MKHAFLDVLLIFAIVFFAFMIAIEVAEQFRLVQCEPCICPEEPIIKVIPLEATPQDTFRQKDNYNDYRW